MRQRLGWGALGLLLVCGGLANSGCDELEEAIQGEAAPLRENDLPNCSRIITCCNNELFQSVAPEAALTQCTTTFVPATGAVIDTYQETRDQIQRGLSESGESVDELRTRTQDTFEPGCRCFLEETVGQIGDTALPADCEVVPTSGALDGGAMCSDAIDTLTAEKE